VDDHIVGIDIGVRSSPQSKGGSDGTETAGRGGPGDVVLVFGGVGAGVIAGEQIGNLGIAFAFGLSLLALRGPRPRGQRLR
jgi:aquaporin Z